MKVGVFSSKFPYEKREDEVAYPYGGSAAATYHVVRAIAPDNEVVVFTSAAGPLDSVEERDGYTVRRYGTQFRYLATNMSFGLYSQPLKERVDIVHVSFDIAPAPYAGLRYHRKTGVPMVVTYHGDWASDFGPVPRRFGVSLANQIITEPILREARAIISPTQIYIENSRFLRRYREKVAVIPNGIVPEDCISNLTREEARLRLGLPVGAYIILFFGYLTPYKGPDILLRAFKSFATEVPEALLIYAGTGTLLESLQREVFRAGLTDRVRFFGYVDDCVKPLVYRAADLFCLPSTRSSESFGIVNVEAMASGLPVISTRIGGIPDVVHSEENGLLVEPNDAKGLAAAMRELHGDSSLYHNLSEGALNSIDQYSWARIGRMTTEIHRRVLEDTMNSAADDSIARERGASSE